MVATNNEALAMIKASLCVLQGQRLLEARYHGKTAGFGPSYPRYRTHSENEW
jgi:hypothetical protein